MADIYHLQLGFKEIFWPSLIILMGIGLIYASLTVYRKRQWILSNSSDNMLEEVAVFGGGVKNVNSNAFRGGAMINVFGGSKIDFTNSELATGTQELNFVSVFGGSSLIIPSDWHVKIEVVSIFGNFSDKRTLTSVDYTKTLIIKGVAIFGGGDIKSY